MDIRTGSDRSVLVGNRWTVKIARTNPGNFFDYAKYIYQHRGLKTIVDIWRKESVENHGGLKWELFHGIAANRRERRLALISDIIVPTRSLLAGVINIQPTTKPVNVETNEIFDLFADNLEQPGPRLGHMLESTENFGIHDGKVKFRDGGSLGLERLLTQPDEEPRLKNALGALMLKHSE